jgi:hypothetical protein
VEGERDSTLIDHIPKVTDWRTIEPELETQRMCCARPTDVRL